MIIQLYSIENLIRVQPVSMEETIDKFTTYLNTPQHPIAKAPPHTLQLCALVLVPGPTLPTQSISSLSSSSWSDILNARLLAPFTTLHAFLPLLISQKSTILFLTPSIVSSLALPNQAAENVVAGGVQQYISTLRKEVPSQHVNIAHFKLGNFDLGLANEDDQQQLVLSQHRSIAGATRERLEEKGLLKKGARGNPLRQLHNDVFDAIVRGKGKNGTVFVGQGSRTYDLVGRWVPSDIIRWVLGTRARKSEPPVVEAVQNEEAGWDKLGESDNDGDASIPSTNQG